MSNEEPARHIEITSNWQPTPQPPPTSPKVRSAPPFALQRLALIPLLVLIGVNGAVFIIAQFPEIDLPTWIAGLVRQLGALASVSVVFAGRGDSSSSTSADTAIAVAMVGALLLTTVARTRFGSHPVVVGAAAAAVAVPLTFALMSRYMGTESAQSIASGLLLGVMATVAATSVAILVSTGADHIESGPARLPWLLALYAVIYIAPVAVGRAANGSGVVVAGATDVQTYFGGLALGATVWCMAQLVPPVRLGRVWTALIALALALGPFLDVAAGKY